MSYPAPPPLSPRLARIASFVPDGARLADIGTDHALLPAHLVAAGRVPSAIAVDVRPGAVAQARRTIERCGVADRVAVRLGDGLQALAAGECDCVVVAGLGGPTIARILDAGFRDGAGSASRLVLGPQSAACRVRWWLRRNGWALLDEAFVEDGGIGYSILVAERGDGRSAYRGRVFGERSALTASMLLHLGPHLTRAAIPSWCAHWQAEADALVALAARTERAGTPSARRAAARMVRRAARTRAAVAAATTVRDGAA
ncbi:MAG: class I SAM-dependent methyltransferase [Ardenticatenales bacterium]